MTVNELNLAIILFKMHRLFWTEVVISVIVLIPSIWLIVSDKSSSTQKHWAYGLIGTILGFWLGHPQTQKPKPQVEHEKASFNLLDSDSSKSSLANRARYKQILSTVGPVIHS